MALSTLKESYEKYKELVTANPVVVSEIESAIRWFSYLTAGKEAFQEVVLLATSLKPIISNLNLFSFAIFGQLRSTATRTSCLNSRTQLRIYCSF